MPFTIKYDPDNDGIAIMGLIAADEAEDFETQWVRARREQYEKQNIKKTEKQRGTGNWHALFVTVVRRASQFTPDPRMSDKPGFKTLAIKTWRGIAGGSFHDARDYVETLMREAQPYPQGNEYPDINEAALTEFSADYKRCCELMESA